MALIPNASNTFTKFPVQYPYGSTRGSDLTPITIDSVSVLQMPNTAIGIFNSGTTDVTAYIIPVRNDSTKPIKVAVSANSIWSGIAFNAVVVTNSVGHNLATTDYLTEYQN